MLALLAVVCLLAGLASGALVTDLLVSGPSPGETLLYHYKPGRKICPTFLVHFKHETRKSRKLAARARPSVRDQNSMEEFMPNFFLSINRGEILNHGCHAVELENHDPCMVIKYDSELIMCSAYYKCPLNHNSTGGKSFFKMVSDHAKVISDCRPEEL
jgi:hypothetical protein